MHPHADRVRVAALERQQARHARGSRAHRRGRRAILRTRTCSIPKQKPSDNGVKVSAIEGLRSTLATVEADQKRNEPALVQVAEAPVAADVPTVTDAPSVAGGAAADPSPAAAPAVMAEPTARLTSSRSGPRFRPSTTRPRSELRPLPRYRRSRPFPRRRRLRPPPCRHRPPLPIRRRRLHNLLRRTVRPPRRSRRCQPIQRSP